MKSKLKQEKVTTFESQSLNSNTLPERNFSKKRIILGPLEMQASPRAKKLSNQFSTTNILQLKSTKHMDKESVQQIKKQFFFHSPQNSLNANQHLFPPLSRQRKNASIGGEKDLYMTQNFQKSARPKIDFLSPVNTQKQQLTQFRYLSQNQSPQLNPLLATQNEDLKINYHESNLPNKTKSNPQNKQEKTQKQTVVNYVMPRTNLQLLQNIQVKPNFQAKQQTQQQQIQTQQTKYSHRQFGSIFGYGAYTHQGIVRNYNEDRVTIVINANKPQEKILSDWPKICFFGVYDGHGGNGCADFLRDNLHSILFKQPNFPDDPINSTYQAFKQAESIFINTKALTPNKALSDKSGSCACVVLIIDQQCYVINLGDSRSLLSKDSGKIVHALSRDHKPSDPNESKRIIQAGGQIYQSQIAGNYLTNQQTKQELILGPLRVFPGRLSVSRTFGDVLGKHVLFGGNSNVIICDPEIKQFRIQENFDFLMIGSDGIYDRLSNKDIMQVAWNIISRTKIQSLHQLCALISEEILKAALLNRSLDNVTVVFVAFQNLKNIIENQDQVSCNFNFNDLIEKDYNEVIESAIE